MNDLERIRRGDAEGNSDRKTAGAWEVLSKRSAPLLIKGSGPRLHNDLLGTQVGSKIPNIFRDSTWFVRIASEGYTDQHCEAAGCKAAFFPVYPMLVRGADFVLPGGALPAALAVSSVTMLTKLERHTIADLSDALKTWRYTPYKLAGVATPACFAVSFKVK